MILHNDITHTRQHFIGGLIAGVGSALSGILGHDSQSSANRAQLKATRETNEMNYKIHKEDQQHAIDMWNMENAYNSPAAQRQRLEEAGYNPYSLFEGGGSTAGNVGLPSSPQMQTPPAEAFQSPMLAGLQQALATFQQATNAIFTGKRVENETSSTDSQIFLNSLDAIDKKYRNKYVNDLYDYQVKTMKQNFEQDRELFPVLKQQAILANSLSTAQISGTLLDNKAKEIELNWLPKEKEAEYNTKVSMWMNQVRIGLKTEQEVKNLIAKEAYTWTQNSNTQKQGKILDEQIEQEGLETSRMEQEWQIDKLDDWKIKQYADKKYDAAFQAMEMVYYTDLNEKTKQKNIWHDRLVHPDIWHFKDTSILAPQAGSATGGLLLEAGRKILTKGK